MASIRALAGWVPAPTEPNGDCNFRGREPNLRPPDLHAIDGSGRVGRKPLGP